MFRSVGGGKETYADSSDFVQNQREEEKSDRCTVIIGVTAQCAIDFLNVIVLSFLSHMGAIAPICPIAPNLRKSN